MNSDIATLRNLINLQTTEMAELDDKIAALCNHLRKTHENCGLVQTTIAELCTKFSQDGNMPEIKLLKEISLKISDAHHESEQYKHHLPETTDTETLPHHLYELQKYRDELLQNIAALRAELELATKTQAQHRELLIVVQDLRQEHQRLEPVRSEVAELTKKAAELKDVEKCAARLREEVKGLENLQKTHTRLMSEVQNLQSEHAKLAPAQKELARLQLEATRLQEQRGNVALLEAKHASLEKTVAEHNKLIARSTPVVHACFEAIDAMEQGMRALVRDQEEIRRERTVLRGVRWMVWANRLLLYAANAEWMRAQARLAKIPYMRVQHDIQCKVLDRVMRAKVQQVDALSAREEHDRRRRTLGLRSRVPGRAVRMESVLPRARSRMLVPFVHKKRHTREQAAIIVACQKGEEHAKTIQRMVGQVEERLRSALAMSVVAA